MAISSLLGGGQQQRQYQDFINRYQQGSPAEGYSDQEVLNRYQQVAPQLPPNEYLSAADQAFSRMSPHDRQQFGQYLQQQQAAASSSRRGQDPPALRRAAVAASER